MVPCTQYCIALSSGYLVRVLKGRNLLKISLANEFGPERTCAPNSVIYCSLYLAVKINMNKFHEPNTKAYDKWHFHLVCYTVDTVDDVIQELT